MKFINIWECFLLVFLFSVFSCKDDSENKETLNLSKAYCDESSVTGVQMCALVEPVIYGTGNNLRAVALNNKIWNNGDVIRIKFLNGDSFFHEKVKMYARKWLDYANLYFEFVSLDEDADIKVAFKWDCDYTTWSMVGTDCHSTGQYTPSMNFGWLETYTSENEFQRVVLHEFGHAIGLVHEHQHPEAGIQWNEKALYEYYKARNWSEEMVYNNIIETYSKTITQYSSFDEFSIMLYAISPELTLNGYGVDWNYELSETDISFIRELYPK